MYVVTTSCNIEVNVVICLLYTSKLRFREPNITYSINYNKYVQY